MKTPITVSTSGASKKYPCALNTPLDQIPLTLDEARTLAFELTVAIMESEGYGNEYLNAFSGTQSPVLP